MSARGQPLVVHEWGTFTSLQDEAGRTIGGINTDDEPVPAFCHDLARGLIRGANQPLPVFAKGVAACHPDVTMRLETPVVYFHPAANAQLPMVASVRVAFHGGWLTQFYPAADAGGFAPAEALSEKTTGSLAWNQLRLGVEADGPKTAERVWTAPRAVATASVGTANGEAEKFLFYRGVGHLVSPLRMSRSADGAALECRAQLSSVDMCHGAMSIRHLWLASFRADGACAFRVLPATSLPAESDPKASAALFTVPAEFSAADYSAGNLAKLRAAMRLALQDEGLFADEADALLNTWESSYFKSAGLRLFFMVPRAWTDFYLPLAVSVPCEIKRAMVGRVDLVTPAQRRMLTELAHGPAPTQSWLQSGTRDGVPVAGGSMPAAYRDLGRFRDALVLDECKARPTPALMAFVQVNGLSLAR
jgi:hypothetical protein